jgi:hypothetical protein
MAQPRKPAARARAHGAKAAPKHDVSALELAQPLGYFGENPMAVAIPNARYALTTGPDGVSSTYERAVAARLLADKLDPSN